MRLWASWDRVLEITQVLSNWASVWWQMPTCTPMFSWACMHMCAGLSPCILGMHSTETAGSDTAGLQRSWQETPLTWDSDAPNCPVLFPWSEQSLRRDQRCLSYSPGAPKLSQHQLIWWCNCSHSPTLWLPPCIIFLLSTHPLLQAISLAYLTTFYLTFLGYELLKHRDLWLFCSFLYACVYVYA